jgi:predicted secreted protein
MTDPVPSPDDHRRAVLKTTVIVLVVVGLAFAFALALTRRLISTWNP